MSWTSIVFAVLTTVLTGLVSWATSLFVAWVTKNIKDKELQKMVLDINEIVVKNVKYMYQVYVEALKDKNMFDKQAQQYALQKCKELCFAEFSESMKQYIIENYNDMSEWLVNKIEAAIYDLKNK